MMKGMAFGSRGIVNTWIRIRPANGSTQRAPDRRSEAGDGVDHQREERDEGGRHNLRSEAEAESENDQRRQRHFRQ